MSASKSASPPLLTTASIVSLLVLALSVTGLFSLHYTHKSTVATLDRLSDLYAAEIAAEQARADFKTQVQEWKNLLLRGQKETDFTRYRNQFETRAAEVRSGLEGIAHQLDELGQDSTAVGGLITEHDELNRKYAAALLQHDNRDPAAASATDAIVRGADRPLNDRIEAFATHVRQIAVNEHTDLELIATQRYAGLRMFTLIVSSFAILASFTLVFLAVRAGRT